MKRRTLLRSLMLGGGLLASPTAPFHLFHAMADSRRFRNPLAIPPLNEGELKDGVRHYTLTARRTTTDFWPGSNTPTLGFNEQSYLGPTLRMHRGDKVAIKVRNQIGEPTTVHWHGMHLPAAMDGGPHQQIGDGDNWTARYTVHQPAATLWYHSHQMHETGQQVYRGMAGLIQIDDETSDRLDLPNEYGVDDIPLILQDRDFARDGGLIYVRHMHDIMRGKMGRNVLVNGTLMPFVELPARRIRFRVLNGANARTFTLGFDDDRPFLMIASDGGLLTRPAGMQRLRLLPGERAEIVVDLADGKPAVLRSYPEEFNLGRQRVRGDQSFDLLGIRVTGTGRPSGIPARLAPPLAWQVSPDLPERRFVLQMAMGPAMMNGNGFTINGLSMDINRIDEQVPVDRFEVWKVGNGTTMPHPFHIHNVQFLILDRGGVAPPRHERGWKDTVRLDPGEGVRLLVKFERYTDPQLPYMYHCHILEHEDAGMMGQFVVVNG